MQSTSDSSIIPIYIVNVHPMYIDNSIVWDVFYLTKESKELYCLRIYRPRKPAHRGLGKGGKMAGGGPQKGLLPRTGRRPPGATEDRPRIQGHRGQRAQRTALRQPALQRVAHGRPPAGCGGQRAPRRQARRFGPVDWQKPFPRLCRSARRGVGTGGRTVAFHGQERIGRDSRPFRRQQENVQESDRRFVQEASDSAGRRGDCIGRARRLRVRLRGWNARPCKKWNENLANSFFFALFVGIY